MFQSSACKISDKSDKFLSNYSNLFWGPLFSSHSVGLYILAKFSAPVTETIFFTIMYHWDDHVTYKLMIMWPEMSKLLWYKNMSIACRVFDHCCCDTLHSEHWFTLRWLYSSATNNRRWEAYVLGSAVCSPARPCVVRPLTPILRDLMSLYIVEGFQLNLAQVINMWVAIAENVFKVRVQTRRSQRGR